ncbi:MAG: lectin-like domain-containing protein, partial [Actinomycetota bacterium]
SVTGSGIYDLNSVSDTVGSISSSGSSTSAMTGDACGRTTTGSDFAEPSGSVANESPAGTWTLTPAVGSQFGAIWNRTQWNTNFDLCIRAELYLGSNDAGADGIAFVLQPNNTAQGASGGGLGYQGITPSFALEFDTWRNSDPAADHIGIMYNGNTNHYGGQQWPSGASGSQSGIYAPVELSNIEDGQWRYFKLNWDSATKNLSVLFDKNADGDLTDSGELIFDQVTIDLQNVFSSGTAYWGFTAATGGANNLQQVRDITYDVVTENQTGPQITLGTAQLTSGGNNGTTTFAGLISGSGGSMVKTGTGTLTLSNANTYTSTTAINAGAIAISNNKALGDDNTTKSSTSVASGAALLVSGGLTGVTDPITINGAGISSANGAIRSTSGNNTLAGKVTLGSAATIQSDANTLTIDVSSGDGIDGTYALTVAGSGNTTVNDPVATSTGTLTKSGSGTLTLAAVNTFSGATTISAGTLTVSSAGQLNSGTYSATIANSGALVYASSANQTLSGVISGSGTLTKNTSVASTLTLTVENTYTGNTAINAGVLAISSNTALGDNGTTRGKTTVANDATLSLSGDLTMAEPIEITG